MAAWEAMGLNEEAYGCVFRETEQQFREMSAIMFGVMPDGPIMTGWRGAGFG